MPNEGGGEYKEMAGHKEREENKSTARRNTNNGEDAQCTPHFYDSTGGERWLSCVASSEDTRRVAGDKTGDYLHRSIASGLKFNFSSWYKRLCTICYYEP